MTEFPHVGSLDPEDKDETVSQSTSENGADANMANEEEVNPTEPVVELDIADPHFMATTHELYADLRAKGPISRVRFAGMEQEVSDNGTEEQRGVFGRQETFFVTHYDEVISTLLDDRFAVDPRSTMSPEQVKKLESSCAPVGSSSSPPLEHYRRPRSINDRYGAPQRKLFGRIPFNS